MTSSGKDQIQHLLTKSWYHPGQLWFLISQMVRTNETPTLGQMVVLSKSGEINLSDSI